jgi:hypothetical protein
MINPFDGPGQIASIAAVIAVIAYLRNVPMKDLRDFVAKEAESGADDARVLHFLATKRGAYTKLMLHSACQLGLMAFIVLLSVRLLLSVLASQGVTPDRGFIFYFDRVIAVIALVTSLGYFIIHLFIDVPEIHRACKKRKAVVTEMDIKKRAKPQSPDAVV